MEKLKEIWIEQVAAPRTWRIRLEVLYPDGSLKDVQLDDDYEGTHFAAYVGSEIIGVISVFRVGDDFQFRKFAVSSAFQQMGIGTGLLNAVFDFCHRMGGQVVWCNARLEASSFYEKFGMKSVGSPFVKRTIAYVRMEVELE